MAAQRCQSGYVEIRAFLVGICAGWESAISWNAQVGSRLAIGPSWRCIKRPHELEWRCVEYSWRIPTRVSAFTDAVRLIMRCQRENQTHQRFQISRRQIAWCYRRRADPLRCQECQDLVKVIALGIDRIGACIDAANLLVSCKMKDKRANGHYYCGLV